MLYSIKDPLVTEDLSAALQEFYKRVAPMFTSITSTLMLRQRRAIPAWDNERVLMVVPDDMLDILIWCDLVSRCCQAEKVTLLEDEKTRNHELWLAHKTAATLSQMVWVAVASLLDIDIKKKDQFRLGLAMKDGEVVVIDKDSDAPSFFKSLFKRGDDD